MWSQPFLPHFSDIYTTLFSELDRTLFLAPVQPVRGNKLENGATTLSLDAICKFLSPSGELRHVETAPPAFSLSEPANT